MRIKFDISQVWYDISFNGRSILELYGTKKDIKQLCSYLELSKKANTKRICVIHNLSKDESLLKKFDKFDVFVIENAQDITNVFMPFW